MRIKFKDTIQCYSKVTEYFLSPTWDIFGNYFLTVYKKVEERLWLFLNYLSFYEGIYC